MTGAPNWEDAMAHKDSDDVLPAVIPVRAAEYVRMSTDQQINSIAYQQAAIRLYAVQRGFTIVRTYADEGRSGLTLEERPAMVRLLSDIESGQSDFEVVVVYDISRWGRFQDPDEGAHLEFRCRSAGKNIEFCAEQFQNSSSPMNAVIKAIKRAMAAEYSRELSARIAASQRQVFNAGFFSGGPAGYGLRRMRVDAKGRLRGAAQKGNAKALRTDRIILVPGPAKEVETVHRIFFMYVRQHKSAKQIAQILNAEKYKRKWLERTILHMLQNERYAGVEVRNQTTSGLLLGRRDLRTQRNDRSKWVRRPLTSPGIISREMFAAATKRRARFSVRYPDESVLLDRLRQLLEKNGELNAKLIKAEKGHPRVSVFKRRFGSLRAAYEKIGYVHPRDWQAKPAGVKRLVIINSTLERLEDALRQYGLSAKLILDDRKLVLTDGRTIVVTAAVCRSLRRPKGEYSWIVEWNRKRMPSYVLIARLNLDGTARDYLNVEESDISRYVNRYFRDNVIVGKHRCVSEDSAFEATVAWALQVGREKWFEAN